MSLPKLPPEQPRNASVEASSSERGRLVRLPTIITFSCAIVTVFLGFSGLASWVFNAPSLRGLSSPLFQMKANTALGLILAGIALLCLAKPSNNLRSIGYVSAAVISLLGIATLSQFIFGIDLGIDQFFFSEPVYDPKIAPGRMVPATAINFFMKGLALLVLDWETKSGRRPSQYLSLLTAFIPFLVIVSYSHGQEAVAVLSRYPYFTQMSPYTAVAWMALTLGTLSARPHAGFIRAMFVDSHSAAFLRRILPIAIATPPILAWLLVLAGNHALLFPGFGGSIFTLISVCLLAGVICRAARDLSNNEAAIKKGHEKLLASNERLRVIVEYSPNAVAMLDKKMEYVMVSQRWLKDYGLGDQDLVGRSHYEVFPDLPEVWKRVHRSALEGNIETADEDPFNRADGTTQWLRWDVRPWLDDEGRVGGILIFTEDITARKEFERSLEEHVKQLAKSNEELERYAYVASHDLKEPLRTVTNCVQLIARTHRGKLDESTDINIQFITDATKRMYDLIDDLLEYSRAGQKDTPLVYADCNAIAQSAINNLKETIRESHAEVLVGVLPPALGDTVQLTQVFQNLLANALKYRSSRPPRIEIKGEVSGDEIHFSIADNGIGIEERFFEKIFGLFQRLHARGEYSGTGLGLAICKRIVLRHGGRIWLESRPGIGSTFFITLPKVGNKVTVNEYDISNSGCGGQSR